MMKFRLPRLSARSLTTGAAVVGVVSLAIGAHAALNKRSLDAARATHMAADHGQLPAASRYALVIGNGHYPDASAPLAQPINDARAMTGALRREGFEVDVVEDASRDDMLRAVDRMKQRVGKDSVVMLYFGGYGIQAGRENYMIPVDARIWKEADVRRSGVSIESVLDAMKDSGVRTKLAIVDASRRNPYERRFRAYSHGLAAIDAPSNALVMTSMTPGKVIEDGKGDNSVLVSALLGSTSSRFASAEAAFTKTRLAVTRATNGAQVPSVSSSLVDDVSLTPVADATPNSGG